MAREYSFFGSHKGHGRVGGVEKTPLAARNGAHGGHKRATSNMQALEVIVANDGPGSSFVCMHQSRRRPWKSYLSIAVLGAVGKLLIVGNFNARKIDWAYSPGSSCRRSAARARARNLDGSTSYPGN